MQKSPPAHHYTTLSGYIFATKAYIDNRKKIVKQYLHMTSQYGELPPTNGWDPFRSLGHLSKFQRVSCVGFVTALTSLNREVNQTLHGLAVSWAGTLHIHFLGPFAP